MTSSLVAMYHRVSQDSFQDLQDGWHNALNTLFTKDNHYTLFRLEDWGAWVSFSVIFATLIIFDNCVLNRKPQALSIARAIAYSLFWIACACGFCGWVYVYYGYNGAAMWMSGYMLEWMLSFDNLFVFHMIFKVYGCPDHLKHRPLYYGICGAIVFRLGFIFAGEYLMHAMFFMHFVFGSFLVYTGVKTAMVDDEDEDPSQHPLIQWLQSKVPFVSAYDSNGSFFVRVPVTEKGELAMDLPPITRRGSETDRIMDGEAGEEDSAQYGTVDFAAAMAKNSTGKGQWRATMLFLVVICLEVSDLLFAVDSVSAIVAQVNDLFLAYTSAVFAMLGLRATFFIVDELVRLFTLLKYGVAVVLTFIGVKLIFTRLIHVPPGIVCCVLVGSIGSSMVASVVQDELQKKRESKMAALTEATPILKEKQFIGY